MMRLKIRHIIPLLTALLLTACVNDAERPADGDGCFALGLTSEGLTAEVVTRAARELSASEAADYTITLTEGDETVWEKRYADITLADRTQPLGSGYRVAAENCSTDEAESANSGWGQRRNAGVSDPFVIVSGATTPVQVSCSMANAGLCVMFDQSFTDYFSEYAVTTDDLRGLKFNADNAAEFDANRQLIHGNMAYYNVEDDGTHTVPVIISASAGWDGTVHLTRSLTLQRGKVVRLRVRLTGSEPTDGNIGLSVTTEDFIEGESEEVMLE
ncbi:MAG: DUF4493 domain-containing protein [Bacteroidaceae bacterium]|nr:DUF4493 domain-containing protein [Bacteroidaceae bacterium]